MMTKNEALAIIVAQKESGLISAVEAHYAVCYVQRTAAGHSYGGRLHWAEQRRRYAHAAGQN